MIMFVKPVDRTHYLILYANETSCYLATINVDIDKRTSQVLDRLVYKERNGSIGQLSGDFPNFFLSIYGYYVLFTVTSSGQIQMDRDPITDKSNWRELPRDGWSMELFYSNGTIANLFEATNSSGFFLRLIDVGTGATSISTRSIGHVDVSYGLEIPIYSL